MPESPLGHVERGLPFPVSATRRPVSLDTLDTHLHTSALSQVLVVKAVRRGLLLDSRDTNPEIFRDKGYSQC
jgi:hypothetical protein